MRWGTLTNGGVVAAVPEGAVAEPMTGGVRVRLAPGSRVEPTGELRVAGPLSGEGLERREVDGRAVVYRMTRAEGGSGGEEVTLMAWIPCSVGHLQLRFTTQAEALGEPDLGWAWQMLARSRCG